MIFSCILVVLVGSAYFFVVTRNKIPDEINIVKGSDKQLSLSIPVSGEIMSAREYSEKETVIPVSLMEFGSGTLYHTDIVSIVRGENGLPGELMGIINYLPENEIGVITQNTDHGVFGKGSEALIEAVSIGSYPVAMKQDIVIGPAQILCNISGQAELYDVEIIKIEMNSTDENYNHGIVVEVTDERLLSLTGGIVQGMSGSPIMQNGKLIGAVTHVFVNNPSRGYGIFIETMLAEQNEEKPD